MNTIQDKILLSENLKNDVVNLIKKEKVKPFNSISEISGIDLVAHIEQISNNNS